MNFTKTPLRLRDLRGARTDKEDDAFNDIKRESASTSFLAHFEVRETSYLDVDCSDKVIGGYLQQYVMDTNGKNASIHCF
jgi:hypothetical protein